jgi:hypothetical protein
MPLDLGSGMIAMVGKAGRLLNDIAVHVSISEIEIWYFLLHPYCSMGQSVGPLGASHQDRT